MTLVTGKVASVYLPRLRKDDQDDTRPETLRLTWGLGREPQ